MIDRNYILNLVKSKSVTIEEFNFDKLVAPPIRSFFSDYDLNRLTEIATSLKYSAKPQVKYQEIDKIMKSRGFVKLSAGTNRVVYRCIENDSIVCKVAYDAVGMGDNPKEFINQNYLKPFCAKTFEVSPTGVLAISERVNPITNREEFISVAEDIFTLITEYIIGKYVMDDIGTKYFMNYGIRKGMGPVILDYSFMSLLDGNKLFCIKPDNNTETGTCGGEIDYDPGYNFLYCKKCGRKYRASELELKIKQNQIIKKSFKGEFNKMKVRVSGGSKNVDITTKIDTKEVNAPAIKEEDATVYTTEKKRVIHVSLGNNNNEIERIDNKKLSSNIKIADEKIAETVNGIPASPVVVEKPLEIITPEKKEENVQVVKVEDSVAATEEEVKVEPVVEKEEVVAPEVKTDEDTGLKKPLKCPIKEISFDNESKEEIDDSKKLITIFGEVTKFISGLQINNKMNETHINEIIKGIKFIVDTARGVTGWDNDKELLDIVLDEKYVVPSVTFNSDGDVKFSFMKVSDETTIFESSYYVGKTLEEEADDEVEPAKEIEVAEVEKEEVSGNNASEEDNTEFDDYYLPNEEDETNDTLTDYSPFSAKIIDISTKIANAEKKNMLVIEDETGSLLTLGDGTLLAIDRIDGIDVNEGSFVSKSFVDTMMEEINKAEELTPEVIEAKKAEAAIEEKKEETNPEKE